MKPLASWGWTNLNLQICVLLAEFSMPRHFPVLHLAAVGLACSLLSCSKPAPAPPAAESPSTPPPVELTAVPSEAEPAFQHDPTSQVSILGYHRFEQQPRDPLAISPREFRQQLQRLKDEQIPVISMHDFLAWRRGEANIPPHAVVITIDDGYDCTYEVARPILDEFGYPYTAFVYLDYIEAGGRSISWAELEELRDSGATIGSHSLTHASLSKRKGRSQQEFDEFLRAELGQSRQQLEERLGIEVTTLAYPYGQYGDDAQRIGREVGYQALFTVNGQTSNYETPADAIGRFVIQSGMPEIFDNAIRFRNTTVGLNAYAQNAEPEVNQSATTPPPALPVSPENGGVTSDSRPTLQVDFSTLANLDPASITISLSGLGQLPVQWNPELSTATAKIPETLREKNYTATVTAQADGRTKSVSWQFEHRKDPSPASVPDR